MFRLVLLFISIKSYKIVSGLSDHDAVTEQINCLTSYEKCKRKVYCYKKVGWCIIKESLTKLFDDYFQNKELRLNSVEANWSFIFTIVFYKPYENLFHLMLYIQFEKQQVHNRTKLLQGKLI